MELRLLRYFVTVANEGSITRAAQILHITQPTLSRQLVQLEKELDTILLVRGKKSISLTDDGLMLYQHAHEIIELTDKVERDFKTRSETIEGTIAIGSVESAGSLILPELLGTFVRKYPQVNFDLYSGYTNDIKEKLDRGLLDIGLLMEPVDADRYHFVRLPQKDKWGILVRQDSPLAEKERVSLADILPLPLIIPRRETARSEIENWFSNKSKMRIFATYNLLSNAALLVEKGFGCAVCLDSTTAFQGSSTTRFIPITPEQSVGSLLLWRKDHVFNPTVAEFIKTIKDIYKG